MNQPKGGLGRGLGALIPTGPVARAGSGGEGADGLEATGPAPADATQPDSTGIGYFREVPVDSVDPNPRQPRQHFDPDALAELVTSIREVGLLQPIVVRPLLAGRFELVMGERRLRATREAGLATIPAIVRETAEADRLRDALLENLHRQGLNPLEEAAAYAQLLEDFGATHEELAARIGRSRPQVTNTIRLLNLPPAVQRRVAAGVLSAGHARALLGLPDADQQEALATRIVAEGMSVRAVEEAVHLAGFSGDPATRRSGTRGRPTPSPDVSALAQRLGDHLDTRVSVTMGRRRGKVVVEFASAEDLERILALIAPGLAAGEDGGAGPG